MKRAFAVIALLGLGVNHAQAAPKHAPSLGDPVATWTKAYGHFLNGTDSDNPGWLPCAGSTTNWQITVNNRAGHAYWVKGAFCGNNPPSRAARTKQAIAHMPADSVPIGNNKTDNGTDAVYFSTSLAHETGFIPGDFTDCNYKLERRGTFSLNLAVDSGIDWTLQLGSCA